MESLDIGDRVRNCPARTNTLFYWQAKILPANSYLDDEGQSYTIDGFQNAIELWMIDYEREKSKGGG